MGIYIKGFKMPEGGYRTIEIAYDADGHPMAITDGGDVFDVIPVPAHGRLIDADELEKEAQKRMLICSKNDNQFQKPYEIMRAIALAPTIIPAEPCNNLSKPCKEDEAK